VTNSGQREINNNKQISYSYILHYWDLINLGQYDHINEKITLSVITLSGFHCIYIGSQFDSGPK
jgi:hypothetical protein